MTAIPQAKPANGQIVIRPTTAPRKTGDFLAEAMTKLNPTFSIAQASALLGICPATTRRHSDTQQIGHLRTTGDQRTFTLADIVARLRAAYRPASSWPTDIEYFLTVWLPSPIVTVGMATAHLEVCHATLRRWTDRSTNPLPHLRYSLARWEDDELVPSTPQRLFKLCDLDAWLLAHPF